MVLGESEITAQVKQAYALAHAEGATGPVLNRLFQKALHCTKVIRSHTRIAEGQASIGSVVVDLTRQLFVGRLQDCEALLWGAGKAAEATARHLIKAGIGQLWIVSRTTANAQGLATLCQAGWLSWEQALKHLRHVDIAIVCTQAPHYVIDEADVGAVLPFRGGRPLFIIDLAVPRNVDPAVKGYRGVSLYNMDEVQSIAQGALMTWEEWTLRVFPKWFFDVATAIHYYEAILACLAILVWHFYFVIFDPEEYPMKWTWLTGRASPADAVGRRGNDSTGQA